MSTVEIICVANWQTFIEWANAIAAAVRTMGMEAVVSKEPKHGDADLNIYFTGNRKYNLNGADREMAHILYQVEERWQDREAREYTMHWGWDGTLELYEEYWRLGKCYGVVYCPIGYSPEFGVSTGNHSIERDGFFFGCLSPRRREILGVLDSHFNIESRHDAFTNEREQLIQSSAININLKCNDMWSFGQHHCMLILALKKFVLAERPDCGHGHFEPGLHYMEFDGEDDLVDKFGYYLKHDKEREEFAINAFEDMKRNHSYDDIIAEALKSRFDGGKLLIKRRGMK